MNFFFHAGPYAIISTWIPIPPGDSIKVFDALASNPFAGGDIKPLKGMKGMYRLRVGNLRVIYEVAVTARQIKVMTILPRGQAYKGG